MLQNPHLLEDVALADEIHLRKSLQEYETALAILSRSRQTLDIIDCAQMNEAIQTIKSELDRRRVDHEV